MEGSDLCPCHPSPGKPPTDSLQRAGDGAVTQGAVTQGAQILMSVYWRRPARQPGLENAAQELSVWISTRFLIQNTKQLVYRKWITTDCMAHELLSELRGSWLGGASGGNGYMCMYG